MDASSTNIAQRAAALRLELKEWEKKFALEHDGRKAAKEDIKQDAVIAEKYKEYNSLRNPEPSKPKLESPPKTRQKRKSMDEPAQTPSKKSKHSTFATPSKPSNRVFTTPSKAASQHEPTHPPSSVARTLFTPLVLRTSIGPTPQKDGQVLGLFDLLSSQSSSSSRNVLGEVNTNINAAATPSKARVITLNAEQSAELDKLVRTPGSSSASTTTRRRTLDLFATPMKRKRAQEEGTPTSVCKHAMTPAFLRRDKRLLDTLAEDEEDEDALKRPLWKKRTLGRSLSSMIKQMREAEDRRMDEEEDVLRELEEEEEMSAARGGEVSVEDSQAPMRLGPDRGVDEEEEDGLLPDVEEEGEKPRKVWKKRGQKRTTRRVIMRPVMPTKRPATMLPSDGHDSGVALSSEADIVRESQPMPAEADDGSVNEEDEEAYVESAYEDSETEQVAKRRKSAAPKKDSKAAEASEKQTTEVKEGVVKKAARKIKATAHANFRRLKIRNQNTKGNKGRFGRGRR